ncbi:MAG: alpha/beta hydrolase [Pseudomonadota bacterium]
MKLPNDPLTPEMREIIAIVPARRSLDINERRRRTRDAALSWNRGALDGLTRIDGDYEITDGSRPAVLVTRNSDTHNPITFVHGGGWSVCDLETHLGVFAGLAHASDRPVWAPHPRQAPESAYPIPLGDIVAALRSQASNQARVAACGDSAGANLLLSAVLKARDEGEPINLSALVLFYGSFRKKFDTDSHREFGDGFGLRTIDSRRSWSLYAPEGGKYADLSGADFTGLPSVQLHLAKCDPLSDDTRWLHEQLKLAGTPCELIEWPGMAHGFLHHMQTLPQAREALEIAARFFQTHD